LRPSKSEAVHEANAITRPIKRKAPPIGRGFPLSYCKSLAVLLAALLTTLAGTVLRIALLLLAGLLLPALLLAGLLIALLLLTLILVRILILTHVRYLQRCWLCGSKTTFETLWPTQ
jgi:hypothetical protein